MKTNTPTKEGYIPVTELETGDTVVNLGIIKAIYPNRGTDEIFIEFDPQRSKKKQRYCYSYTDKLKVA